jgi:hypothetical protein
MTTIVWKYSNLIIKDPVSLGAMAQEEDSLEYEIEVSHDSNEKISECAFIYRLSQAITQARTHR